MSQFRGNEDKDTLANYVSVAGVYPAGRLDFDSEGLLLLTDDGKLQAAISQPRSKLPKRYWAQVEGEVSEQHLAALCTGLELKDGPARALSARRIEEPSGLWDRVPPIRHRETVPDSWLELAIDEGRNRQIRRMTAAVGLPTLRLIRSAVGPFSLAGLQPGEMQEIDNTTAWQEIRAARAAG